MEYFIALIAHLGGPRVVAAVAIIAGVSATLWRTGTWALFLWWFVVTPWERALRVRTGKSVVEFGPGLHFRIPYIHVIYRQSVRLRFSSLTPQTISTRDGHTITCAGVVGYCVANLRKLYDTMHHPESTIISMAQSAIAGYVFSHDLVDCDPTIVQIEAAKMIDLSRYGLECVQLRVTTYARVKTYRLIMDTHSDLYEGSLSTRYGDNGKARENIPA